MKRLLFDVSKWHLYLHRDARALRPAADSDAPERQLEDELFDGLYGGERAPLAEKDRSARYGDWAQATHAALEALPAFGRLSQQCRGDAGGAALAVEALLDQLGPVNAPDRGAPGEKTLRRAAIRGVVSAERMLEELNEAREGLGHVSFGAGTATGRPGASDGAQATALARALREHPRLRELATLAGRFKRVLADKRRTTVRHGADELTDIEQGAALATLLPSELMRLSHRRLRMLFLRDLLERRCLQYQLTGRDTRGRGPLVVCLDKSGSMEGAKDLWATAVALALLDVAMTERRPFGLVSFNAAVLDDVYVPVGGRFPAESLFVQSDGGTDIDAAIDAALTRIETTPPLGKADVVLITDGASDPLRAEELRARAAAREVSILGVAIDSEPAALKPWCARVVLAGSPQEIDGATLSAVVAP